MPSSILLFPCQLNHELAKRIAVVLIAFLVCEKTELLKVEFRPALEEES